MGYRISSLKKTPKVPGLELYVFIVGSIEWKTGFSDRLMKNFDVLARNLGEKGAIVAPHDGSDFAEELSDCVNNLGNENKGIQDFLATSSKAGVGLMLMSSHPNDLTDEDLVLYSPLELLDEQFGALDHFFTELCSFAAHKDASFVSKFSEAKSGFVSETANMIDLNPNIFGIGVNLNPLKEKVMKKFGL
ncbi:hypothetical protein [Vibrio casei]|uniref:Uncharacterized protein n=1 Tax=Vibrio casei TaxID=673372 RepID=A0A368LG84_9VIBR|nr:hypothetical protein [Vibrio casei]RCS69176.1 hypothetical protein CIK83_16365 [Vibrio casei]SJN37578.1 hypothetical protein FM109_14925 [Vibrio casei]